MKKLLLLCCTTLTLFSCNQDFRSRGPMATEKRNLLSFNSVSSDAVAKIILVQDSVQFANVSTYQNLLPEVTTEVENRVLHVSMKKEFANISNPNITVEVHTPDISELVITGVGSIQVKDSFRFHDVAMKLEGVGSIKATGTAHSARMENNGTGSIDAAALKADSVFAITSGVGSISCYASSYLNAHVQGIGSISYRGNPVVVKSIDGIGSVNKDKE